MSASAQIDTVMASSRNELIPLVPSMPGCIILEDTTQARPIFHNGGDYQFLSDADAIVRGQPCERTSFEDPSER